MLEADKVHRMNTQKKGISFPVKNSIHSEPERVFSVGFLCFFLLNFGLITA